MGPLGRLATQRTPFFFISDFLGEDIRTYEIDTLEKENIAFAFNLNPIYHPHPVFLKALPESFEAYKKGFDRIIEAIKRGETYVLNYTRQTPIVTETSLSEIFQKANAKFKLFYKDQFVCFSPEPFVIIENDMISTFPMKGTIDAAVPDAKRKILANPKEHAEHIMVVDLLRNDLNQVAKNVRVERLRYVEEIAAGDKKLLQVSSHIAGDLDPDWRASLDDIMAKLLPAGSISGTPKKSTLKHILEIENFDRGFYSGVMGYFDGEKLTTSIMIRFIEKKASGLFYKSGGGITIDSDPKKEYQEMIDKIYIP